MARGAKKFTWQAAYHKTRLLLHYQFGASVGASVGAAVGVAVGAAVGVGVIGARRRGAGAGAGLHLYFRVPHPPEIE